ncbi:MAG: hypothetical protein ABIK09_03210 [Pseudomonadota bacterium]
MIRITHLLALLLLLGACSGESARAPADIASEVPEDLLVTEVEADLAPDLAPDLPEDLAGNADDTASIPDTPADVPPPPCPTWGAAETVGHLANADLFELSGLVASRTVPGVFWAHNDSGDGPRLFALDATGADLGVVDIDGAQAKDWEDIGIGPCPGAAGDCLYIGDIGDNPRTRSKITVYVVPEPSLGEDGQWTTDDGRRVSAAMVVHLTYPDGARDAEALLVDPGTGDVYVIEKTTEGSSTVYRAAAPLTAGGPTVMETLGDVGMGIVTGADITADGALILVRNYFAAAALRRPPGTDLADAFVGLPCDALLGMEFQGESVAFTGLGVDYVTIAEGAGATVFHITAE